MVAFRRVSRLILLLVGILAGLIAATVAIFARLMIQPPRQRIWATPADVGLVYEEVHFPARDGVRLAGWFIPAGANRRDGATITLIHGWPWNRLGSAGEGIWSQLLGSEPVHLLRLALALQESGYNVLMFDLRNHGVSAAAPPVTFGLQEAQDLLGALEYLTGRPDVNGDKLGAVGFSMGGNTILFSLPRGATLRAAIAVQPTSPTVFDRRFGRARFGWLNEVVNPLAQLVYRLAGGLSLRAIEPVFAAAGAGATAVLYVQGRGDPWGSVDNVARMAAVTPGAVEPLFVESEGRFDGYRYVVENPAVCLAFFQRHLA
jgi:pimeloyl-ACP methyl ester carboxylesterase